MNKFVLNIFKTKFVGTEPHKSFLINENCQRLHISDEYINPEIPLIPSDQVRVSYIPLDNTLLLKVMQLANVIH